MSNEVYGWDYDSLEGKSTKSFEIIKKTKNDLLEHKGKVEASLKTKEETNSYVTWTFGWKIDYAWLKKEVNYSSYESLVKGMSFEQLKVFYDNIDRIQKANNLNSDGKWYSFTPFNIGELKDEFIKNWYEADWAFWWEEMASLIQLIENVYNTQLNLKQSKDFKDSLGIIFDYNQDWLLDDNVHFVTQEKQIFDAIKTPEELENLLKNLGYSSLQEFNTSFQNNYFNARSEFKDRLWTLLLSKDTLNPWEMIRDPEALKKFETERSKTLKVETEAEREVDKIFEENEGFKKLPPETKKLIKLQAVWVLVGSSFWVWVTFDIKEATAKLIDSLSFGIIDWVPWVWIAKNIYKSDNERLRVDVWAVNFIPIISASWVLKEWDIGEFKKLFPNEIDKSAKVTLIGWLTPVWQSIAIDFTKVSEKTEKWIKESEKKMSEILDKVSKEIIDWKSFDQSSFKDEPANKIIYERLASMYKANWWHMKPLIEWALVNYKRALYQNAEWFQFTWGWAWLLFVAGFLPIPLVLVHWEKHSTKWEEKDTYGLKGNKKQKTIIKKTSTTTSEKTDYMKPGFEWKLDLNTKLELLEKAFSPKTRYNKGALKFMDPKNDLNTRWEWLEQLAWWVKALKKVDLKWFLETVKTENEKMVVISTLSQYMKKASDFNGWDIKSWNTNLNKFINNDKDRRKSFDGMFGFSLQEESDKYYNELSKWKWQIWETKIQWIWFDAVSSKNVEWKTVKWIDTLYTNLSILTVNWKPVLVPITDKSKIEAFKKTISWLKNISEQVKNDLITWIDAWTIELNYYKDPQGFDDRILPIVKTKETTVTEVPGGWEASHINVYNPIHSTVNLVGAYVWNREEEKKEEKPTESEKPTPPPEKPTEPTSPTTTPGQEPTTEPITEPWTPIVEPITPIPVEPPTPSIPPSTDPNNPWR